MEFEIFRPKQPIELTLKFENAPEAEQLYNSLRRWTPTGGWSDIAEEFFAALMRVTDE